MAIKRKDAFTYAALCLLTGSAWVLDAALPSALPGALALLVDSTVLALVFFAVGRRVPAAALRKLGYLSLILAVPVGLVSLCDGRLSSTTIVLVYTLVPVATVFFAAQASQEDVLRLLGPALAGVAGAALILPFTMPGSRAGALWLGGMMASALAAGFAALRLHELLRGQPIIPAAALAATSSALIAVPLAVLRHPSLVLQTWQQALFSESVHLSVEAFILLLTLRLVRDLAPIAVSTRYLVGPLVTIAEGYLILHPTANWTLPAGLLLLAGSSAMLLRAGQEEHQR